MHNALELKLEFLFFYFMRLFLNDFLCLFFVQDKEFVVLTLPHNVPEFPLLQMFQVFEHIKVLSNIMSWILEYYN